MMRCKSHVMITVGTYIGKSPAKGEKGRHTFVLTIFFIWIVIRRLLVGVAGVWSDPK